MDKTPQDSSSPKGISRRPTFSSIQEDPTENESIHETFKIEYEDTTFNEDVSFPVFDPELDEETQKLVNTVADTIILNYNSDTDAQLQQLQKLKEIMSKNTQDVNQTLNTTTESVEKHLISVVSGQTNTDLKALLETIKNNPKYRPRNKKFLDHNKKSGLRLAIDERNKEALELLLKYGYGREDIILYAIKKNYVEGVEVILEHDKILGEKEVHEDNIYFKIGMTPMLLAAELGRYEIMKVLHKEGKARLDLKVLMEEKQERNRRNNENNLKYLQEANQKKMLHTAEANPAYITLFHEKTKNDPFEYCLGVIADITKYHNQNHEFKDDYCCGLVRDLEQYMCTLLDQVRSSDELSILYKFTDKENSLDILEKANKKRLISFVTHEQSQMALSSLCHDFSPKSVYSRWSRRGLAFIFGLFFPIISIFYIFCPKSKIGKMINIPMLAFSSHMWSDLIFVLLLLVNILNKRIETETLGQPLTFVQVMIIIWILAKWEMEIEECVSRGCREYFNDYWNYNDIALLLLFTLSIILRFFDIAKHKYGNHDNALRSAWGSHEPRLIAESLQAFAYVFVFLRLSGMIRVHYTLGPLQISLSRMLIDVLKFLVIFSMVILAFAFGLSDLYWYYGTEQGKKMFCKPEISDNITETVECSANVNKPFTSPSNSLGTLFWALFGYMEVPDMELNGKHTFTHSTGVALVGVYHVVAIIIMLNMLIAMMNRSYERTSENQDREWKFHRTSMWIRYIKDEVVLPPPMNLVNLVHLPRRIATWNRERRSNENEVKKRNLKDSVRSSKDTKVLLENSPIKNKFVTKENLNYPNLVINLVERYKFNFLVEN